MNAPTAHVAPGSDRVRLAALAADAAVAVDGVAAADAGPHLLHITASGTTSVIGARVVAESPGRYSIDLGLCARLVPLEALAEQVRVGVIRAVTHAGLGERLGAVGVTFHDVADPAAEAIL